MYLFQYIVARFFIFILLLFPEKCRFSFGNFLGALIYKLIKKRREIALYNLKLAFPNKGEKDLIKIAKKSFKIMIKAFICTLWFDKYLKNPKKVKIINKESFEKLYSQNRGIVVAAMHFGNMEACIKVAGNNDVVTVAKKQRNPYINNYMKKNRSKYVNVEVIEKSINTSKELLERAKQKKVFALFSDHRDSGAIVEFFDKEAKAPTGAVSMAIKYDMPLILVYNILNSDNTTTIFVSDEIKLERTGAFKKDVQKGTQTLINEFERIITRSPEQWMWFHDRWNIHSSLRKLNKNKN